MASCQKIVCMCVAGAGFIFLENITVLNSLLLHIYIDEPVYFGGGVGV